MVQLFAFAADLGDGGNQIIGTPAAVGMTGEILAHGGLVRRFAQPLFEHAQHRGAFLIGDPVESRLYLTEVGDRLADLAR